MISGFILHFDSASNYVSDLCMFLNTRVHNYETKLEGICEKYTVFSSTSLAYLMAAASLEETEEKELRGTNHYRLSRGRTNSDGACIFKNPPKSSKNRI